jgi:hypothetical protein
VFGASQVGKSYLVSCLGQNQHGQFNVNLAGARHNFLREINPSRLKEATGVVTRFTSKPSLSSPSHPVELTLLGEMDLAKILGNSFLADFDQHKRTVGLATVGEIVSVIAALEAKALPQAAREQLDEVDMFDIGQYFKERFRTSIGPLSEAGYWDALVRFGHRLPDDARTELLSLLWGSASDLTRIFVTLSRQLRLLGHPTHAHAHLSALLPRERSVIDVNTLLEGLGTDEDIRDAVEVIPLNHAGQPVGQVMRVPRASLTALVSELKLSIEQPPWPFLAHTDLLDFPGARTREAAINFPEDADVRSDFVRNMFLRGKVAYLFQQYTEALEVPAMLLGIAPSNQEVKYTSEVTAWVEATHGEEPAKRSRLPCGLFVVLTKVDMMLAQQSGDSDDSLRERVVSRVSGVYSLFSQEAWLRDWDGKPLGNFHFLRNPSHHAQRDIFEIEGDEKTWRETGLTQVGARRSALILEGMMRSEQCLQHFGDGAAAWGAAVTPDDGGVSRLVANLEKVLSPDLKVQQIGNRLRDQAESLDRMLRPFFRSADQAAREKKRALLTDVLGRLFNACKDEFKNFAALQSHMMVDEANARPIFSEVATLRIDAQPAQTRVAASSFNPWGAPKGSALSAPQATTATGPRDRFDHFAAALFSAWEGKMRSLSQDLARQHALGLISDELVEPGPRLVPVLVNEILDGARRLQLSSKLAIKLRDRLESANVRWDQIADRALLISLMHFNDFVATLGFADRSLSDRPQSVTGDGAIFDLPPVSQGPFPPSLGDVHQDLALKRFLDWGTGLLELGVENVSDDTGSMEDRQDNHALGEILRALGAASSAATN